MIKQFYLSNKALCALLLNLIVITVTYYCFLSLSIIKMIPDEFNVLRYDAGWFDGIRKSGYIYPGDQMSNMAFFPLFPYLWKWSFLDPLTVSFVNVILFAISYVLLIGKGENKFQYFLITSSLPCFIFFFLPYSEGCFFLFGTLLILGYRRNNTALLFIGLFGCCLTRSVSTFFIPAVIITELLAYQNSLISKKKLIANIICNVSICLCSILVVVILQGVQTGKWFYYIEVQKYWQRHWLFPSIPFTTISPNKVLGVDAAAMVLGCIAILFCLKWVSEYLYAIGKSSHEIINKSNNVCKSVYFSSLFLAAIVIIDTCFTYNIDGRTNMQCMNRHLMCTAFAICFLEWLNKDYVLKKNDVYFILGITLSGVFISGVFEYTHLLIYYILFCISFFVYRFFPRTEPLQLFLWAFNIFFIVIFYHDFINGFWIG